MGARRADAVQAQVGWANTPAVLPEAWWNLGSSRFSGFRDGSFVQDVHAFGFVPMS